MVKQLLAMYWSNSIEIDVGHRTIEEALFASIALAFPIDSGVKVWVDFSIDTSRDWRSSLFLFIDICHHIFTQYNAPSTWINCQSVALNKYTHLYRSIRVTHTILINKLQSSVHHSHWLNVSRDMQQLRQFTFHKT